MKHASQIRPEWIPNAYTANKLELREEDDIAKMQPSAPLYSGGKTLLKAIQTSPVKGPKNKMCRR